MIIISATHRFSAHYSKRFACMVRVKTNSFFIHKNRSFNCDTGWVLCHILMAFISILFKPHKDTPTMDTPST